MFGICWEQHKLSSSLKNYFPGLEDEDDDASEEANVKVEEEVPTASEVVNNAKNVANDAKKLMKAEAKKKMMKFGAEKLGMKSKDLKKLNDLNKMRKAMKGGNKDSITGGLNETVDKAMESAKELGIFFTLPGLFLLGVLSALALQIIPFAYMISAFYDNNIFMGLFMITLGGLFFYPMMGMGYFIKIWN